MLLHGGAGPASVKGLAKAIAVHARALVPTHPGFASQPRPDWFYRIDDVVLAYLSILEQRDLNEVVVIGNSLGGWTAAEMALRRSPRIAAIVLVDAVGIDPTSADTAITNSMTLPPAERASLSFHDPKQFAVLPQTPEAFAMLAENQKTSLVYAGQPYMHDPSLGVRLAEMMVPALVLWGSNDHIVVPAYGRRFADDIPGSRFEEIAEAGHFPRSRSWMRY